MFSFNICITFFNKYLALMIGLWDNGNDRDEWGCCWGLYLADVGITDAIVGDPICVIVEVVLSLMAGGKTYEEADYETEADTEGSCKCSHC